MPRTGLGHLAAFSFSTLRKHSLLDKELRSITLLRLALRYWRQVTVVSPWLFEREVTHVLIQPFRVPLWLSIFHFFRSASLIAHFLISVRERNQNELVSFW